MAPGKSFEVTQAPRRAKIGQWCPMIGDNRRRRHVACGSLFSSTSISDQKEAQMPRGDKSAYTDKQKRQAEHIEEGYEDRGVKKDEAERRAWATVNATTHGGKKSGSGRGKSEDHSPERKGGHIGGSSQSHAERSRAAKKGWETRRREG
jgi:plasmid stabilization system protein ParE